MTDDAINNRLNMMKHGSSPESEQRFISSLNRAIQNDQLLLHYQPRYSCSTRNAQIVEALVRWKHPTSGLFYPELFLSHAEHNGLIYNIDLWVFEKCCKDLKWLRKHVNQNIRIAMNISVVVCESIYFAHKLISICEKHELSFSDFEFEITEGTHNRDFRKLRAFCETLSELGATFNLDDFGIGQSALTDMCALPLSLIKIDKSFVRDFAHDSRIRIMVEYLVKMAHKMQLQVVAEGVEEKYQLDAMTHIGCDQVQGFFLCRPGIKPKLRYSY
jgi:EAL domain-containing protein (putative c-di-GMP-specific phosphodiesterase class I)